MWRWHFFRGDEDEVRGYCVNCVGSRIEAPIQMEVASVVFLHQPKRWLTDQVVLIHELVTRASCNSTASWSQVIKFHEAGLKQSKLQLSWSVAKSCIFCVTC